MPWAVVAEELATTHPYKVLALRAMIAVPYFEKALYELADDELTPERVRALADEVEADVQGGLTARPLLSVPHLLSDEASCYYHGYVLAEMAVHQTRAFILARDGRIVDNPAVGPTLTDAYWRPGNSEPFLGLVERCTGAPLSGDAWVRELERDVDALLADERAAYDAAAARDDTAAAGDARGIGAGEIDLDMRVRIVDGDEVIADTAADGGFLGTCAKFEAYVRERFPAAA